MDLIKYVAETINVKEKQVSAALDLLKQGATVPFMYDRQSCL